MRVKKILFRDIWDSGAGNESKLFLLIRNYWGIKKKKKKKRKIKKKRK